MVAGWDVASSIGLLLLGLGGNSARRWGGHARVLSSQPRCMTDRHPASAPRPPDTGCRRSAPARRPSRGSARSASATCGPGRATPPDASTMASTGRASCCPGSATAHRVVANGTNGRRNSVASFACFMPTTRCTGRSDHDRRCSARTIAGAGIVPAVQPQLPVRRQQRGQPAMQALQPRRPFRARRCRRAIHRQPRRAHRGDGDAGVVELERARQRWRRQVERRRSHPCSGPASAYASRDRAACTGAPTRSAAASSTSSTSAGCAPIATGTSALHDAGLLRRDRPPASRPAARDDRARSR